MREFFVDARHDMPFELFGTTHLLCLTVTLVILFLLFLNRDRLKNLKKKTARRIVVTCASIMLANMMVFYMSHIYYGTFSFKDNLPIHLCYLAGFSFMFAILFEKYSVLKYTFFLAVVGPLPATIWPSIVSSLNSFGFYSYFFSHHFLILSSFMAFYVLRVKITYKDVVAVFFISNLVYLVVIGFNHVFDTNYMFSNEIPGRVKLTLPFVSNFHPILVLEVMGLAIIHVLYLFARKTNREIRLYQDSIS